MLFLTIIIALLVVVLIYVLLIPIILFVDTNTNQYYVQLKGIAKANVLPDKDELLKINLKVFFWRFKFYPLRKNTTTTTKKKTKVKTLKRTRRKIEIRKILRLLKSFKIKRFHLNIDTGDSIMNAKLFPFFAFLNYRIGSFNINFKGTNHMVLHMQNRPIHIIRSFIKF